ncbi:MULTISPECIES: winged helix-turn-helix domain-containing protein [unclassified Variovorax]|uniref:GntR family transcriptional regulator n=1 Tax=unclassified Variovorax TaxID=663243 RepID=UPI000B80DF80|nr:MULTISPECIES: winged helix-turn-helix domain-containing protein [unclassified Variovorax]
MSSPTIRCQRLQPAALAQAIASDRYPVGSLLPTEFELCDLYGESRYAVRMALDELREQGLISRKKNVGSRVEAARTTTGFLQSLASVEDLPDSVPPICARCIPLRKWRQERCWPKTSAARGRRWVRISPAILTCPLLPGHS